jgi:hypothetical protein
MKYTQLEKSDIDFILSYCKILKIQLPRKHYNYLYRQGHKNKAYKYRQTYYVNNRELCVKLAKDYNILLKQYIIDEYGGKCACCGESQIDFLTIDHINNDGAAHKKEHGTRFHLYAWLKRNNYPKDNFQLLCYNCNCAKGKLGYCPHNKKE